jgi:hypothetical protein
VDFQVSFLYHYFVQDGSDKRFSYHNTFQLLLINGYPINFFSPPQRMHKLLSHILFGAYTMAKSFEWFLTLLKFSFNSWHSTRPFLTLQDERPDKNDKVFRCIKIGEEKIYYLILMLDGDLQKSYYSETQKAIRPMKKKKGYTTKINRLMMS